MITYNHEEFIKEAIKGILMQETEFRFEFIIANDASADQTDKVIAAAVSNCPAQISIRVINHKENLGMMENFISTLSLAKGKYIAICEGDDYWTDKNKLQEQMQFLTKNEKFSLCFHPVNRMKDDELQLLTNQNDPSIISFEYLQAKNIIHPVSAIFKADILDDDLFNLLRHCPMGDWPIFLKAAKTGPIQLLPKTMANYRMHPGGVWSLKRQHVLEFQTAKALIAFSNFFSKQDRGAFLKKAAFHFENFLRYEINNLKGTFFKGVYYYYLTSLHRKWYKLFSPIKWILKPIKK